MAASRSRPRARDLGVPFSGTPGEWNAVTDVRGVVVGHTTLIRGEGAVFAGWFSLNGNGEMTGTTWVEESGFLEGPIAITNTHSVGTVRDTLIAWSVQNDKLQQPWSLPLVAETWDGDLNDINGFHVKP